MVLPGFEKTLRRRARVPDSKPRDRTEGTQTGFQSPTRLGAPGPPRDPSSQKSLSLSMRWEKGWGLK